MARLRGKDLEELVGAPARVAAREMQTGMKSLKVTQLEARSALTRSRRWRCAAWACAASGTRSRSTIRRRREA